MNQRFKITRSMQENNPEQHISLEECSAYFATKPEFTYSTVLNIVGAESTMTIEGDFLCGSMKDNNTHSDCIWGNCTSLFRMKRLFRL